MLDATQRALAGTRAPVGKTDAHKYTAAYAGNVKKSQMEGMF